MLHHLCSWIVVLAMLSFNCQLSQCQLDVDTSEVEGPHITHGEPIDKVKCQTRITPDVITDSWQSSNPPGLHLFGLERACCAEQCSINMIHTPVDASNTNVNGYHWFAIRLKKLESVSSVIIDDGRFQYVDFKQCNGQSDGIELWTSPVEFDFGQERCRSSNISSVFISTVREWRLCGKTASSQAVSTAIRQPIQVNCGAVSMVRMVLLRKNIADALGGCMSFVEMKLQRSDVATEIQPSKPVKQNSSVTVSCNVRCPHNDKHNKLRLCHANTNSCLASGNLINRIESVQPTHSGNYTCRVGDEVLSNRNLQVLYPPNKLRISVVGGSCSAESHHVTFEFESSAAAPTPNHMCSAFDSHGNRSVTFMRQSDAVNLVGVTSQLSHWMCDNCNSTDNMIVQCSAVQLSQSGEILWNSSAPVFLGWSCVSFPGNVKSSSLLAVLPFLLLAIVTALIVLIVVLVIRKRRLSSAELIRRTSEVPPNCTTDRSFYAI